MTAALALARGFDDELRKLAALKPDVKLQPQQADAVTRARAQAVGGMVLNWGLGSGKTIGSLAIAEDKGGKVLVVVPAALRENFKGELKRNVEAKRHGSYTVISYNAFREDPEGWIKKVKPTTLIADEFHRLRNPLPREPFEKVRSQVPFMVGLTGSLVNNRPEEIVPLTNLAAGRPVFPSQEYFSRHFLKEKKVSPGFWARLRGVRPGVKEDVTNLSALGKRLAPVIHRFTGDEEYQKHVPKVVEKRIEVQMNERQQDMLASLEKTHPSLSYKLRHNLPPSKSELKNMNAFMTAARQISNVPGSFSKVPIPSPKLDRMVKDLHQRAAGDKTFKAVIYSNFLEAGVQPIVEKLRGHGIKAETFTGSLSDKQRAHLVGEFNKGKIQVLGLSPAGGEGLDLKGVKLVQLTEEHWNPERANQAVGRSTRYKSHEHLPEAERQVQVNRYLAVYHPTFWNRVFKTKVHMSPDQWIDARRQEKLDLNQKILKSIPEYRKAAMVSFFSEIAKLAKPPAEPPPSKLVDGLCEVFGKEKPRTPMQKAQEITDRRIIDEIRKNPQNQVTKSHAHLVHSDPGMTTPGM